MARVEIASLSLGCVQDKAGNAQSGVTATITNAAGGAATVYAAATGTSTTTPVSSQLGYLSGWIEEGTYTFTISGTSHKVEVVSGSPLGIVNVKAYGAEGDGATDDTAAIQNAADAAVAIGGRLCFPPGGVYLVDPGVTNASGTSVNIITLGGPCEIYISRGATVRVKDSATGFQAIFGATTTAIDMTGFSMLGGGTVDANSATRIAAGFVPGGSHPCIGVGLNIGSHQKVLGLRWTRFDSVWVVTGSSSNFGNQSDIEVAGNQFDNLGHAIPAQKHDFSCIYLDAIGMSVHHNVFWQGNPGAQQVPPVFGGLPTFAVNYGARTAIECHGSHSHVHHNKVFGLQWGCWLASSQNSWIETDEDGSRNAVGIHCHDNDFYRVMVGAEVESYHLTDYVDGPHYYGLDGVFIHHNTMALDAVLWNVDTGVGPKVAGVSLDAGLTQTGAVKGLKINDNVIRLTPNCSAMNAFAFTASTSGTSAHIALALMNSGSANTRTARDWTIARNTLVGSLYYAIGVFAHDIDGLIVEENKIRDCSLFPSAGRRGIEVSTINTVAGTNQILNAVIADNEVADDQTGTHSPWGYTGHTLGAPVFMDAGNAGNVQILDNAYYCADTALLKAVAGFTGWPAPFVRATCDTTLTTPDGKWAAGSTLTLTSHRNSANVGPISYVQTAVNATSWDQAPMIGSGVPTIRGTAGARYHRTDTPTVANQREYICTVAGGDGAATWVGFA